MPELERGLIIKKGSRTEAPAAAGEINPEAESHGDVFYEQMEKRVAKLKKDAKKLETPKPGESEEEKESRLTRLVAVEEDLREAQEKFDELKKKAPAETAEIKRAKTNLVFLKQKIENASKPHPGESESDKEARLERLVAAEEELREKEEELGEKQRTLRRSARPPEKAKEDVPGSDLTEALKELRGQEDEKIAEETTEETQAKKRTKERKEIITGLAPKKITDEEKIAAIRKEIKTEKIETPDEPEREAPTEEAWFAEGEKAAKAKEEGEEEEPKIEKSAKKRSRSGLLKKPETRYEKITEIGRQADKKLDAAIKAIEDAKKELKDENFDVDKLTAASGFEQFFIRANIFSKRGRLLRKLYKEYIDAINSRDLELLRSAKEGRK